MNVPEALAYVDKLLAQHAFASARGWFAELGIDVPPEVTAPAEVLSTLTTEQLDAVLARPGQPSELLACALRERARRPEEPGSFAAWSRVGPPTALGAFRPHRWQLDLAHKLEQVVEAVRHNPDHHIWIFQVEAPSQVGKSEIIKRFLGWCAAALGLSVAVCSYNGKVGTKLTEQLRMLLRSDEALAVWPHLDGRHMARGERQKDAGDDFTVPPASPDRLSPILAGRGKDGSLTSYAFDLIALDDMYKSQVEYRSPAERDMTDSLIRTAVLTRLMERGGVVLNIGTRWGDQDTHAWWNELGKELQALGITPRIVTWSYPVRAVPGHPDAMNREPNEWLTDNWNDEKLTIARAFYGAYAEAVLFCRGIPDTGIVWKREHFVNRYTLPPNDQANLCEKTWLSVDGAATSGRGDWTVIQWWGSIGPKAYLLGQWRGQWGFPVLMQTLRDVREQVKPNAGIVIEKASSGIQAAQTLELEVPGVIPFVPKGSKRTRWEAVQSQHVSGTVLYPLSIHAPWMGQMIDRRLVLTGEGQEVDDEADTEAQSLHHRLYGAKPPTDYRAGLRALQTARPAGTLRP